MRLLNEFENEPNNLKCILLESLCFLLMSFAVFLVADGILGFTPLTPYVLMPKHQNNDNFNNFNSALMIMFSIMSVFLLCYLKSFISYLLKFKILANYLKSRNFKGI